MKMEIKTKEIKSIFGNQIVNLYDGKISYFRKIGKFMKLKGDIEWCFYPDWECCNLEYLNKIMKVCKEIEARKR